MQEMNESRVEMESGIHASRLATTIALMDSEMAYLTKDRCPRDIGEVLTAIEKHCLCLYVNGFDSPTFVRQLGLSAHRS